MSKPTEHNAKYVAAIAGPPGCGKTTDLLLWAETPPPGCVRACVFHSHQEAMRVLREYRATCARDGRPELLESWQFVSFHELQRAKIWAAIHQQIEVGFDNIDMILAALIGRHSLGAITYTATEPATEPATELPATELVRGAVMNAGRHSAVLGPRWWHVAELLGIGSVRATKLCWRFSQLANEQLGPRLDCEEGCSCECHKD